MVLLSRVVAHDDNETICQAEPEAMTLFYDGAASAWQVSRQAWER